jgi:hypothetical protein
LVRTHTVDAVLTDALLDLLFQACACGHLLRRSHWNSSERRVKGSHPISGPSR